MTDTPLSDDVVEKVAVRIADAGGFGWSDLQDITYSVFDDPQGSKRYWRSLARAALEAARYGEMVEALKQTVIILPPRYTRSIRALLSSIGASQP